MKPDLGIANDLINLSSRLSAFAVKHINSTNLKSHIIMQTQMLPKSRAVKPEGVLDGITARAVYGKPQINKSNFEENLKRSGPIFVANEVGSYALTHDAVDSIEFLNNKIAIMTLAEREQFNEFINAVEAVNNLNPVEQRFLQTAKMHALLNEDHNAMKTPSVTR